ncbi:hypothetical protein [Streptomyces brasiliscabiei]|uniref:Uncharacterized protein n=1 Tax=Streptomyces brasiliscabiei TaxID=2736302 RepID=A0ABU8GUD7_9ACTN
MDVGDVVGVLAPVTTMRHPAASATAADIPNPAADSPARPATWAA